MGGIGGGFLLEFVMYFLLLPNGRVCECHSRSVSVFRYAILAFLFLPYTVGRPERFDSGLPFYFVVHWNQWP